MAHFGGQAAACVDTDETEIDGPQPKPQPKPSPRPAPQPKPSDAPKEPKGGNPKRTWLWVAGIASAWCSLLQPYLAKNRDQRPALTHFSASAAAPDDTEETVIDEPKQKPQPKVEPQPKPEPEPKPSPKKLTWLWVLLGILVIGGGAVLGIKSSDIKKNQLKRIIAERIEKYGPNCDLNDIDVSKVTNMEYMFYGTQFNGDISKWDVSNVTDMSGLFFGSQFNGDISKWDVSNVTDMSGMFRESQFNGDISKWNVSNVTNMRFMFYGSPFNGDISKWDVSKVTNMKAMFRNSPLESHKPQWYKWFKAIF